MGRKGKRERMKRLILLGIILLCFISFNFSTYYVFNDCIVYDYENNDIISPTFVDLDKQGVYEYFKPEFRPKPIIGLKLDVIVSYMNGIPLDSLRCN